MDTYWIVNRVDGQTTVFIAEAADSIGARIKASLAGHKGDFVEYHVLTDEMARKIPKAMMGRVLNGKKAKVLLDKLGCLSKLNRAAL